MTLIRYEVLVFPVLTPRPTLFRVASAILLRSLLRRILAKRKEILFFLMKSLAVKFRFELGCQKLRWI